ncbi:MAG: hypothetical protein J5716_06155 [Alphaproteobacteria bacterium]|nr:hypothetical protein [Alphaproteobacteria bacterium]
MKKSLFLIFVFCLMAAGCVSGNNASTEPAAGAVEHIPAPKPEVVIRSGRKDPLLKADYVLEILGRPAVRRYEKPSEVWVYPQEGCVLFVYMADQEDGSKLVRHMEIGTPTFKTKEKDSVPCLKEAVKLR